METNTEWATWETEVVFNEFFSDFKEYYKSWEPEDFEEQAYRYYSAPLAGYAYGFDIDGLSRVDWEQMATRAKKGAQHENV